MYLVKDDELTPKQKLILLSKNYWSRKDIQNYFFIGRQKTLSISAKLMTIKNSTMPFNPRLFDSNVVLELFNTTRENEIKILRSLTDD